MKLKQILENWLPPVIYRNLSEMNCNLRFFLNADRSVLARNNDLSRLRRSERAFLFATGPSIKGLDLDLFRSEDCFSLSNFFLHRDLSKISPILHFFAPYHPPLILENYVNWLGNADKMLPPGTRMVLGYQDKGLIEARKLFSGRDRYYLYFDSHVGLKRNISLDRPVLAPQTGPIMMLPVLFGMGYKEIYLMGCDHNTLLDYGKHVRHFYNADQDMRVNASDPGVWIDMIEEHRANLRVFLQYQFYQDLGKKMNVSLFRTSEESWLTFLPLKQVAPFLKAKSR